jgi:hypothetical protein
MAHTVKHGDVFELPLVSGERALCRITYKSRYFRNVVQIAVHGLAGAADPELLSEGKPVAVFYGSSVCLRDGRWRFVSRTAPRPEDVWLSKRLVGGDVWIEDDHVGPPAPGDEGLAQMDVYGDKLLAKVVQRVLEG